MAAKRHTIGRARAVFVFGRGGASEGALTSVVARPRRKKSRQRLIFSGSAAFQPEVKEHLRNTVMTFVEDLLHELGLRRRTIEISVVNLAAASVADTGLHITGYSADVPVLLALLSAALKMPVRQDVVTTGHLASSGGDIRPVRGIPAKVAAAAEDPGIVRFVYPSTASDRSLQILSPKERQRIEEAIVTATARLETVPVTDVGEVIESCVSERALVMAALGNAYFGHGLELDAEPERTRGAVAFLMTGNEQRFWRALEADLRTGRSAEARELLAARAKYQTRSRAYPSGLGRQLLQLVQSLPPTTRRLKLTFPLLQVDECAKLVTFAKREDQEDVACLFDAVQERHVARPRQRRGRRTSKASAKSDALAAVEAVLEQIDAGALAQRIGKPIDDARAAYVLQDVIADSYDLFLDTIAAFYLALLRHTELNPNLAPSGILEAEAVDLLERAFRDKGGRNRAWAEARDGVHGGLRFVLDVMTEQFRTERQTKHVSGVLVGALDPLDWNARVAFMEVFLDWLAPHLPSEIREQPPEQFVRHYELILLSYVRSLDQVKQLLRSL